MSTRALVDRVSADRLEQDLWTLVGVPSPTGREGKAAEVYAQLLSDAGATVTMDRTHPSSPSVVGRLRGTRPGPVLQLAGHLDHIDVPHAPPRRERGVITSRGAADMKNGLAAILSIVRALRDTGDFAGEVLVTAYGLHEAPLGTGQGLASLIDRGILGDAALVMEGPAGVVVAGKGQSIWRVVLTRAQEASHETDRPAGADELLVAASELGRRLVAENRRLAAGVDIHPILGPETVFVGQLHYGDFYNRAPKTCFLEGTMRWNPPHRLPDAQRRLEAILADLPLPPDLRAQSAWTFVGEGYTVDPRCDLASSLRWAHHRMGLGEPADVGTRVVLDTNLITGRGGVPSLPIDCDGSTRHSDAETVRIDTLARACRLGLLAAARYLGAAWD